MKKRARRHPPYAVYTGTSLRSYCHTQKNAYDLAKAFLDIYLNVSIRYKERVIYNRTIKPLQGETNGSIKRAILVAKTVS